MPTALPASPAADIVERSRRFEARRVTWLVAIWAAAMLLVWAVVGQGTETGAMDPFELLATF